MLEGVLWAHWCVFWRHFAVVVIIAPNSFFFYTMESDRETPLFQRLSNNGLQQLLDGALALTGGRLGRQQSTGNRQNDENCEARSVGISSP